MSPALAEGLRDVSDVARDEGPAGVQRLVREATPIEPPPRKTRRKAKAKESQADSLVKLAISAGAELFHDPDGEAYARVPVGGHHEVWRLRTKGFKGWLARLFWEDREKAPSSQAVTDALNVLEGLAVHEGEERKVFVRVARVGASVYLDLGDEAWRAIELKAEGWRIVTRPPVMFLRPKGLRPLPDPIRGGSLDELAELVNVPAGNQWALVKAWLVGALRGEGPFWVLAVQGEQGSAKSTLSKMLRALIDPSKLPLRSPPKEERDLVIAAQNGWVVGYDNLSGIPAWLSDSLCRLATGGGFGTRALYTDNEEALFDVVRPILVNGIDDMLSRADLAQRSIVLDIPAIPDEERRDEQEVWAAFNASHARILGALCEAVCCAQRREPSVKLERPPRMADAARWATAAEPALGLEHGAVMRAICGNREEAVRQGLEAEPLADVLMHYVEERGSWTGAPSLLLKALKAVAEDEAKASRAWPKNASSLSSKLQRLAPSLRRVGVLVERGRGTGGVRYVSLRWVGTGQS